MKIWYSILLLCLTSLAWTQVDTALILPTVRLSTKRPWKDTVNGVSNQIKIDQDAVLYSDASGYLVHLPGVTVKDYGGVGGLKTVSIRGLNASMSTVLYNGVAIPNYNAGQVDISQFSLAGLSAISSDKFLPQSTNLPASSYNGSGFIAYHLSQTLRDTTIIGMKYGSFNQYNPHLYLQRIVKKKHRTYFSIDYNNSQGNFPFEWNKETRYRDNSETQRINLLAGSTVRLGSKSKVNITQLYNKTKQNLPGAVILHSLQKSHEKLNTQVYFTQIHFESVIKKWNINTYVNHSQNKVAYTDGKPPKFRRSIFSENNNMVSLNIGRSFSGFYKTYLALDYLHTNIAWGSPLRDINRDQQFVILGNTFHKSKISLKGNLLFHSYKKRERQKRTSNYYPSLSCTYRPNKKFPLKLRTFYKKTFRLPSFSELYYQTVGNLKLRKETAHHFDLGIYTKITPKFFKFIYLSMDLFYIQHQDKIIAIPTQSLFVWSYLNIGKVESKGLEIFAEAKKKIAKNTYTNFSFSYTKQYTLDISNHISSVYKNQLPYVPFDVISMKVNFRRKNIKVYYQYLYNGYRYSHFENIYPNVLFSFQTHDVAVSYLLKIKSNALSISGGIKNLTNSQYQVVNNFPIAGRQFFIKADVLL